MKQWHVEARQMRAAGATLSVIAKRFSVTQAAASYVCKGTACPVTHRSTGRPAGSDKWSPIADKFILEHYGPFSASQIGQRLGVSRNAIIGRVHRLRKRGMPA